MRLFLLASFRVEIYNSPIGSENNKENIERTHLEPVELCMGIPEYNVPFICLPIQLSNTRALKLTSSVSVLPTCWVSIFLLREYVGASVPFFFFYFFIHYDTL